MAVYTANLLNQYEQRDVPGRVRVLGSALPQAIITVNNEQTTRQQGGYFHWSQAVTNTNSAAYPGVSILAVLQGAGTNGADIVATETGRVFVAESPELFTYDLDGNLLTDGRWTNTWDGENRLIRVETRSDLPGEVPRVRADFTYDGQGRRIQEQRYQHDGTSWVSTASTRFLYDGWLLLAAVDDFDAFTRTYTWGLDLSGSMQGAGGVGGLLAMHQGGSDYAYAYDGNGNVIALIATDGTTTANYEYGPFGEPLRATGPAANANRFRFSTKWEDQDTGWLYYGYRWLDPGTGRWLNRDPIGEEGGINLYIFAGNNALIYYDYLGLSFWAYFHDGVRVVSGAFTVAAGGAVAAGASWTGVGAVGGIALVALGVDQLHYGAANIVNRARGRGAYAGSGIQTTYRFVSRQITGVDSSGLEVRLDEFYAAAEIASACATGYISVRSAVTAVKGAQTVRSGGRWVPVNGRIQYQFQLYGGLTWKEAGGVVATESFSVFLSGISFLEQNNNQPPSWGDGPPPSTL